MKNDFIGVNKNQTILTKISELNDDDEMAHLFMWGKLFYGLDVCMDQRFGNKLHNTSSSRIITSGNQSTTLGGLIFRNL